MSGEYKQIREKRMSVRKFLLSSANCVSRGMTFNSIPTIDLSLGGLSFVLTQPLDIGSLCTTSFDVPIGRNWQRTLTCGHVVYCLEVEKQDYRIGICFSQVDGQNMYWIRNAVEHHLKTQSDI